MSDNIKLDKNKAQTGQQPQPAPVEQSEESRAANDKFLYGFVPLALISVVCPFVSFCSGVIFQEPGAGLLCLLPALPMLIFGLITGKVKLLG